MFNLDKLIQELRASLTAQTEALQKMHLLMQDIRDHLKAKQPSEEKPSCES